jgi:hypothetical protein
MKWNTTNRLVMACLLLVPVLGLGLALGYWTIGELCAYLGLGGALGMAVTADQIKKRRGVEMGAGPVAATTTLYEGTFCFWNATGYLDDDTGSGANKFAGIVLEQVDNSTGADGDLKAEYYQEGIFYLEGSGFAITDIGKEVFASDNYTITLTDSGSAVPIGVVAEYVSATELGVRIYGSPHQVSLEGNVITFAGSTGANEIRIPDNLADGLSIEGDHGDFIVFTTTNGAEAIAVSEATTFSDHVTFSGAIDVTFFGTTGQPEVVLVTNLADALSVKDAAGDLVVVTTTTGSQVITITPATTVTGLITANGGITIAGAVDLAFTGTTGQPEIVVPDNLADALSIKDGTGGADILVITTTNSAETVAYNVPIRLLVVTTAVAAAGSTVADAGQLARANIVHVSSDGSTKGVKLATGVMGDWIFIINDSSTACELYAASGGTINGLAANASVVIPASKGVWCQCTAADTWIAFDLPAKASAS